MTVAAHDLESGTRALGGRPGRRRWLPVGTAPHGLEPRAVGRTLAAPIRRGEPVTDVRLVAPALTTGYPGRVALPVRIADADMVGLLRVGDHVDLVAADPRAGDGDVRRASTCRCSRSRPPPTTTPARASLSGRLVVVAALPGDVDRIAGAAATDLLSVVITR